MKSGRINIIKIICCMIILLFHTYGFFGFNVNNETIMTFIELGACGCTIFFMCSGFCLQLGYGGGYME